MVRPPNKAPVTPYIKALIFSGTERRAVRLYDAMFASLPTEKLIIGDIHTFFPSV